MKITFVNVGYGEAILLEWEKDVFGPEGFTVLIDGGGRRQKNSQTALPAGSLSGNM